MRLLSGIYSALIYLLGAVPLLELRQRLFELRPSLDRFIVRPCAIAGCLLGDTAGISEAQVFPRNLNSVISGK
jgi:hypothetical protein